MGMYTDFYFKADLERGEALDAILPVLRCMVEGGEEPSSLPDHPLFQSDYWPFMLRVGNGYFDDKSHSRLLVNDADNNHSLVVETSIKGGGVIEWFVDWITPYLNEYPGDFLGFKRYEETDIPTLLYHPNRWVEIPESVIPDDTHYSPN